MIDKIKKILHQTFEVPCKGNPFDLKEDAPEAKCKIARFEYHKGDVIAYKFDKRDETGSMITVFPFFGHVTDLKKICDFILFYQHPKNGNFVILCNLKSNEKGTDTAQMAAAQMFVDFIMKSAKRVYKNENFQFQLKKVHYRSKKIVPNTTNPRNQNIRIEEMHLCSNGKGIETCNLDQICR